MSIKEPVQGITRCIILFASKRHLCWNDEALRRWSICWRPMSVPANTPSRVRRWRRCACILNITSPPSQNSREDGERRGVPTSVSFRKPSYRARPRANNLFDRYQARPQEHKCAGFFHSSSTGDVVITLSRGCCLKKCPFFSQYIDIFCIEKVYNWLYGDHLEVKNAPTTSEKATTHTLRSEVGFPSTQANFLPDEGQKMSEDLRL